jgi:hypothetical protein
MKSADHRPSSRTPDFLEVAAGVLKRQNRL